MLLGFVHGDLVGLRSDDQAQAIVAVDAGDAGFFADDFDLWLGIDSAEFEHFKISVQPGHAVGIDAAQIAFRQYVGGLFGIRFRHAEVNEHLRGKIAQISVGEEIGFGFLRGYGHDWAN